MIRLHCFIGSSAKLVLSWILVNPSQASAYNKIHVHGNEAVQVNYISTVLFFAILRYVHCLLAMAHLLLQSILFFYILNFNKLYDLTRWCISEFRSSEYSNLLCVFVISVCVCVCTEILLMCRICVHEIVNGTGSYGALKSWYQHCFEALWWMNFLNDPVAVWKSLAEDS